MGNFRQWLIIVITAVFFAGSIWILVRGLLTRKIQFDDDRVNFGRDTHPAIYWVLVMVWAAFVVMWGAALTAYIYLVLTGQV